MKLVSLLPSATEILVKLGLEKYLVGVSHECDYPKSIESLPRLTSTRINPMLDSSTIHKSVLNVIKDSLSIYDIDIKLLKVLDPDFIITQDLCDVCAVSFSQVEEACQELVSAKIISLKPKTLADIWVNVKSLAEQFSIEDKGFDFCNEVELRISAVQDRLTRKKFVTPNILTIEWIDPIYVGGMWLPEMINIVGGQACIAKSGQPAPVVNRDTLAKINPDIVIVKPCGYSLPQNLNEISLIKKQLPWQEWTKESETRLYLVDGNSYFNRPGPRILDSLEILAYCTHPGFFPEFGEKYVDSIACLPSNFKLL
jgi:iron complex transport system substrate-binding protein